jgi:hypothetical protein
MEKQNSPKESRIMKMLIAILTFIVIIENNDNKKTNIIIKVANA